MGTSFGDAAFLRCWARWWALFNNIDVKIQRFSFFPPLLYGEDRSLTEPEEERGRNLSPQHFGSCVFPAKGFFFTRSFAHVNRFALWLFYILLRLDSGFPPTRSGIPEWLTAIYLGTGLPIVAYPDRVPIQSSSSILNVLIALYPYEIACSDLTLHCPVFWDLIFSSSPLHKHRWSFRSIALSGAEIWQW